MSDAFTATSAFTKIEEGGYTSDPRDSGNWSSGVVGTGTLIGSNMGVGAPAAVAWMGPGFHVTAAWMKALPAAIYTALAKAHYWRPLACDSVPPAVALMLFDYGWNRGIGNGGREFQETLGISGSARDGDIGPKTLATFAQVNDLSAFVQKFSAIQEAHYRTLATFNIYGNGWIARSERRVTQALALLAEPPDPTTSTGA